MLNPVFASSPIHESDYVAVLTDPSDGMTILESAQDGMLNVNYVAQKMFNIAIKAATGQYSREQLDKFDSDFQKDKLKYLASLNQALGGSLIFNQGNFSIVKNNVKYTIDLAPKNTVALGIANDHLFSIDSAKTAVDHINAAIDTLHHWIPQGAENNLVVNGAMTVKKNNTQENNYFDSSILYINSSAGAESALKSIENVRDLIINLLTQIAEISSQATSDVLTPANRMALDAEFQECMHGIDQMVASASFSAIKAFDGSVLVVHDIKQGDKTYKLPDLPYNVTGNIMNDDVVSPEHANIALHDLANMRDKLAIWLVDGVYDSSYVTSRVLISHK